MYSLKTETTGNLVELQLSGKVSGNEYKQICASLTERLERQPNFNLLCELDDFQGIKFGALWRAALVATDNRINLRRIAVVGAREGYKWARALVRGFHAETLYFDRSQRLQAMRWLGSRQASVPQRGGLLGDASYRVKIHRDRRRPRSFKD